MSKNGIDSGISIQPIANDRQLSLPIREVYGKETEFIEITVLWSKSNGILKVKRAKGDFKTVYFDRLLGMLEGLSYVRHEEKSSFLKSTRCDTGRATVTGATGDGQCGFDCRTDGFYGRSSARERRMNVIDDQRVVYRALEKQLDPQQLLAFSSQFAQNSTMRRNRGSGDFQASMVGNIQCPASEICKSTESTLQREVDQHCAPVTLKESSC